MKLYDPIPSFDGATRWVGEKPDEASLRGHPVLVHIWSSACPECKNQFGALRRWAETWGPRGLRLVGLHARSVPNQSDDDAVALIERCGFEHPIAIDAPGAPVTQRFHAHVVPSYYVFDAQGRLRHRQAGYGADAATEAVLERIVHEAEGAGAPGVG